MNSVIDSRVGATHPCATYLWFILILVYRKNKFIGMKPVMCMWCIINGQNHLNVANVFIGVC